MTNIGLYYKYKINVSFNKLLQSKYTHKQTLINTILKSLDYVSSPLDPIISPEMSSKSLGKNYFVTAKVM